MESIPVEVADLIFDQIAESGHSLLNLSQVSKRLRSLAAPRVFNKLYLRDVLNCEEPELDAAHARLERLLQFASESEWAKHVQTIKFELRWLDLEKMEENDIIMDAQDIISQSSVWFPETLTYILSNLNTCFPSVDTLKLSFPGSCDQDDNFDIFLENVTGVDLDELEEESYHHVLKKLLDMTFSAVVNNARKNLEDAALPNSGNEIASRQYIKHFSISNYPPFDCAILTSPTARAFFSQLVSFSLKLDRDYDMDDGGYYNPPHCWFLTEILPSSFLSHFYAGSSLERLRIKVLDNCCMGVAEGFPLHGERMGSLKKLVLENVIISRRTAIDNGLGSFIQANHDTLEEILLDAASWYTEQLDQQHSSDNWGAFWEFLRKNCPAGLQRLEINGSPPYGHLIARNEPSELAKTLDRRTFAFFRYVELSVGFGYVQVDEGENAIPEFRMEDDFKKWSLLRNSILGKSDNI